MLYIAVGAGIGALIGVGGLWCALMFVGDSIAEW